MRRFFTVVLICSTVVLIGSSLFTPSDRSLQLHAFTVLQPPVPMTVITAADGFTAGEGHHHWSLLTRKYKPRSTQPVRLADDVQDRTGETISPEEDISAAKRMGRYIDHSCRNVSSLCLDLLHTSVERKVFPLHVLLNVVRTA